MNLIEITRTRTLPYAGTVVVEKGQYVSATAIVAEMNYFPGLVQKLQVARHLAVEPEKLSQVVQVAQGDMVEQGQVLAFDTHWYRPQVMLAPMSGIIGIISRHLGIVYLRKLTEFNPEPEEIHDIGKELGIFSDQVKRSITVKYGQDVVPGQIIAQFAWKNNRMKMQYVTTKLFGVVTDIKDNIVTIKSKQFSQKLSGYLAGKVVAVEPNWSVTIKSQAYQLAGVYGIGGERSGWLRVIDKPHLQAADVLPSDHDKIIVVRGRITAEALLQASEYGVPALVGAVCKLAILRNYVGEGFIPSITGSEPIKTGVILVNGFSGDRIDEKTWNAMEQYSGCQISVNGTTHIRAGAIRPEILIFPNSKVVKQ